MSRLNFSIDAALLEELGEQLIGKPYMALAELIKNSYDADAKKVTIKMDPKHDRIEVSDTGQGMTFEEFKSFWMKIGSVHKRRQRVSRKFRRPLTGSKGVGRLAVQLLAGELELVTTSENDLGRRIRAHVDWKKAVQAEDLTKATVEYKIFRSSKGYKKGTTIILKELKREWTSEDIKGLAQEIWWLQPPFRIPSVIVEDPQKAFVIEFSSPEEEYEDTFNWQMEAIFKIWYAKIVGKNKKGKVRFALQYAEEEPIIHNYSIKNCLLNDGEFEIRIYHLIYRQPHGLKVGEAREYLNKFGGIHVYDGGFHLPYYGDPKNDWLKIEFDHSHRLHKSKLLPKELRKPPKGLQFLPTLSRTWGVVNVDTATEPKLRILITRDRLQESKAFTQLVNMVRYTLDFYAYAEKRRSIERREKKGKIEKPKYRKIEEVVDKYREDIPKKVYSKLRKDVRKAAIEIETEAEEVAERVSLMGSLATAGISSLAYQHETKIQFRSIEDVVSDLKDVESKIDNNQIRKTLSKLRDDLLNWVERAKAINALFSYFADPENLQNRKRFRAKKVIKEIKKQVEFMTRGIKIHTKKLDEDLFLPKASLTEWSSIFQNVFINAFNALLDSEIKKVDVSSRIEGKAREILIQDTGCGVNLKDSEKLFEPFVRKLEISPERRALGYGGTGLGLTIVRLIAYNIGCEVSFVKPEKGFSTAFSLRWREAK